MGLVLAMGVWGLIGLDRCRFESVSLSRVGNEE
jgi:hypothetical protein